MRWIDRCLNSLLASTIPTRILVIDNSSDDGTSEYIKTNFPSIELICSNVNLGFGAANNIGFQKALDLKADYVFLLNQDASIEPNTVKILTDSAGKYPKYGVLSPMHWNGNADSLEIKFNEYLHLENTPKLVSDYITQQPIKQIYESQFINAAAWLLPIHTINEIGGFDPLFYHYGEDEDYVKRLRYNGLKLGVVPSSIIYHDTDFKSWDDIKWNFKRMVIIQFLEIKRIDIPFRSSLLKYYKDKFNRLTDLLLYRKWKEFVFLFKVVITTTFKIQKVKLARRRSIMKKAFL